MFEEILGVDDSLEEPRSPIDRLRNVRDIQCSDGNWDYNAYMMGMANGLILAVAIMEDSDPVFKDPPMRGFLEDPEKPRMMKGV